MPAGLAAATVLALTLAGLALRLAIPRGLWLDEATSVHQAHLGLAELIQNLAQTDRHPPLHAVTLWATIRTIGDSDFAVRVPSIIAGTLVVPALYALGRELYDRRTGVAAAVLGTVAPLLVWYSQEARGYAFVTLFAVLAVLGCARVLRRGGPLDWALYTVAASLLIWSHWFAGLLVLCTQAFLVVALFRRRGAERRRLLRGWLASAAVIAVQLIPLGMLAAAQLQATGSTGGYAGATDGGSGVSFYTVTSNVAWLIGGFHPDRVSVVLSAVWPLAMLVSLLVLGVRAGRSTLLLGVCTVGPIVGLLVLGAVNPGVFEVRYFLAAAPLGVLLLARLAVASSPRRARQGIVLAAMFAVLAVALADQQLDPRNPRRYDYREALAQVRHEVGPRDVLLYEPPELRTVLERYAPDIAARPLDGTLPTRAEARRVVVLGSFLDQARYRQVVNRQIGALRYARRQDGRSSFPGAALWTFR
jgi:4-amino-4-deoxy-L-arabinose transferase-like glycosyltransferase